MKAGHCKVPGVIVLFTAICSIVSSCSKKINLSSSVQSSEGSRVVTSGKPEAGKHSLLSFRSPGKIVGVSEIPAEKGGLNGEAVVEEAREYLGIPHCMGGKTAKCLDCSGFVMIVFREFGLDLPRTAQEQSKEGTTIKNREDLLPGDLVFFQGSYRTDRHITHSGIYIGEERFIHTSSNSGVTITSLNDSYWKGKYAFGSRVIR